MIRSCRVISQWNRHTAYRVRGYFSNEKFFSSWRPWFWPVGSIHIVYYSCTLCHWNHFFLRNIYMPKVGVVITLCWMIWFSFLFVSNVYFNCIVQDSLYYNMDIGTMWHYALISCTAPQYIELFWGVPCAGVKCHYVLLLLVPWWVYHDFHQDSCDYHLGFYGHPFHFQLHV